MTARPRQIVIVAYGAAPLLAQTLDALASSEQVVVVDNSSCPQVRAVTEAVSNVKYVDPGENLGFAAAVNVALGDLRSRSAAADVLLLNPDATITSAQIDVLQTFLDRAENADVAAVSPALATPDGAAQRALWPYPSPRGMWRKAFGLGRFTAGQRFAVGAVLLLRREALAAVGQFDERYFLYAEEADWQRRAANLGWRSALVDEVTATHVGAATSVNADRRETLFHAAQETYIRRWFGPKGWMSYRLAAVVDALLRAAMTTGPRRRRSWSRAHLYLAGPRRQAAATPPGPALRVTHVVVTGNSAGTERYVAQVAAVQASDGHCVTVVGGDPAFMRRALPSVVTWRPGETPRRAARSLQAGASQDIVHTHLTSADAVGVLAEPWHGARIVSTRHIAKQRGSKPLVRTILRMLQRRIAVDVCISDHVRRAAGVPATVLPNGVRVDARHAGTTSTTVLLAQRLEPEKATDIALAGWAASGLAARGWTLQVCGDGSQQERLQRQARNHGIAGVVWSGWVEDLRATMLDVGMLLAPAATEPFGLSVVEAMSVGLPVVAAAGGGHLETVGLCPQAMLFTPGDAQDCARQLAAFAAMTPTARASYGAALQQLQQRRFDIADHVARLDGIYRSALECSPVG